MKIEDNRSPSPYINLGRIEAGNAFKVNGKLFIKPSEDMRMPIGTRGFYCTELSTGNIHEFSFNTFVEPVSARVIIENI